MKKYFIRFTILALLVLIASCSLVQETGTISIPLPDLSSREVGTYEWARVYLSSKTGPVDLDSGSTEFYKDVPYSDGSFVISNINPAYQYDLVLLFGNKTPEGVFTEINAYSAKIGLKVTSGLNNKISMAVSNSPFSWDQSLKGQNILQAINVNGVVYTLTSNLNNKKLFASGAEITGYTGDLQSIGKGKDSKGVESLWINTSKGIFPYKDGVIDTTFFSNSKVTGDLTIERSGTLDFVVDGDSMVIGYYQGPGTVGGVNIEAKDPSKWQWFGIDDAKEAVSGIETVLEGLSTIIYDFKSMGDYAYVATALPIPAFRITGDMLEAGKDLGDKPAFDDLTKLIDPVSVKDASGKSVTVKTVGIENGYLYFGSDSGIYTTQINTTNGELVTDAAITTVVSGTEGLVIKKMEVTTDYVAAITGKNGVVILKNGAVVKAFKNYEGLPGKVTDILWNGNILNVVGPSGLVTIDASI